MYEVIERAVTQLSVLSTPGEPSALSSLTDDFELTNRLVSKFPWVYQREWDKLTTRDSGTMSNWDLFNNWLSEVYQEATQTKMRALCVDEDHSSISFTVCRRCKSSHKPGPCASGVGPVGKVINHLTNLRTVTNKQELQQYNKAAQEFAGPCPSCNQHHTYEKQFTFGKF